MPTLKTEERVIKKLKSRRTGATTKELATVLSMNEKTVRNILGRLQLGFVSVVRVGSQRKCKISGNVVNTYLFNR